jgi:microcystin-dependent protein
MRNNLYTVLLAILLATCGSASAQTSIGIGTTTPDSHAVLDVFSTTKGVLFPRLTAAQQATLGSLLGPAEMGMIVIDAATGTQKSWTGNTWTTVAAGNPMTAAAPLSVSTNTIKINAGTNVGDLLTWDGTNWVNTQPAVQHFSVTVDNHQPYLVNNYVIGLFGGIYPSQSDASTPYIGEIYMMGCNFAPTGFAFCDGQLLPIAQYSTVFNLIGTTYGGDGVTTFALPNLQGRVPIHMGNNGTTNYIVGQTGGTENQTFTH